MNHLLCYSPIFSYEIPQCVVGHGFQPVFFLVRAPPKMTFFPPWMCLRRFLLKNHHQTPIFFLGEYFLELFPSCIVASRKSQLNAFVLWIHRDWFGAMNHFTLKHDVGRTKNSLCESTAAVIRWPWFLFCLKKMEWSNPWKSFATIFYRLVSELRTTIILVGVKIIFQKEPPFLRWWLT